MRKSLVLFLWLGCLPMAAQVKAPDLSPGQQGPGSGFGRSVVLSWRLRDWVEEF